MPVLSGELPPYGGSTVESSSHVPVPDISTNSAATVTPYQVTGGSNQFNSRSNDIFAALESYEAAHESYEERHNEENQRLVRADPTALDFPSAAASTRTSYATRQPQATPSSSRPTQNQGELMDYYFRRPSAPVSSSSTSVRGCRTSGSVKRPAHVPDHVLNPHKYTKYSLDDVSSDDMSESSNRAAALSFLAERRAGDLDNDGPPMTTSSAEPEKIRFRSCSERASQGQDEEEVSSSGSSSHRLGGGKFVMSEYVVGLRNRQRASRTSTHRTTATTASTSSSDAVRIDYTHIYNNDEDDETTNIDTTGTSIDVTRTTIDSSGITANISATTKIDTSGTSIDRLASGTTVDSARGTSIDISETNVDAVSDASECVSAEVVKPIQFKKRKQRNIRERQIEGDDNDTDHT